MDNVNMPQSKHSTRPEIIQTRLGVGRMQAPEAGHHGRRVAAKYSPYYENVCVVSIFGNMIPNTSQRRGNAVIT